MPGKTEIEGGDRPQQHQYKIINWNIANSEHTRVAGHQFPSAYDRKQSIDEDEQTGQMPAHVPVIGGQTKTRSVVMINRKNDCDQAQESVESRAYLPSVDAFIVFSFDAIKLLGGELLLAFFGSLNLNAALVKNRRQGDCRRL